MNADFSTPGKIRFVTAFPMHPAQREIYRGEKYDGQD
jgi:hypothetical protein